MWKEFKSCIDFCCRIVIEEYTQEKNKQSGWYQVITWTGKLIRASNVLLNSLTSMALVYAFIKYGYPLLGKRWWAIIFLSLIILSLLFLISTIKRYHERILKECRDCVLKIGRLSEAIGAGHEIHYLIDRAEPSISKDDLIYWQAHTEQAIDFTGAKALIEFRDGRPSIPAIPDTPEQQLNWVSQQNGKLRNLIRKLQEQSIPVKTR